MVAASASLEMTLQPSRSWATGINRVVIWLFDNMYSPEECWEQLRFHKDDMPELLRRLRMHDSGEFDGGWRYRDARGVAQYVFEPMEMLVIFLARMASASTWSSLVRFLGGRGTTAYQLAFGIALDHVHDKFSTKISDITRWAGHAERFARAIRNAGELAFEPTIALLFERL